MCFSLSEYVCLLVSAWFLLCQHETVRFVVCILSLRNIAQILHLHNKATVSLKLQLAVPSVSQFPRNLQPLL